MSTVILSCGFLRHHVDAAQQRMQTNYAVIEMDTALHAEPKDMRAALWETMENLDADVDTVLLAMGLCGGSVSELPLPKNIVMPRVDDCITMLMHTDDIWHPNLKAGGHMYFADDIDGKLSIPKIYAEQLTKYGEKKGKRLFDIWFESYRYVDIIDTGCYDCRSEDYLCKAKEAANLIHSEVQYVDGSNILLEKLVSGKWDQQFIVAKKGQILQKDDFLLLE